MCVGEDWGEGVNRVSIAVHAKQFDLETVQCLVKLAIERI
jgi:hypothetical protein